MLLNIYTIHDNKAMAYLSPFTFKNDGQAVRLFGDAINNQEHTFAKHPADYTLFNLGEFDDNTSEIKPKTTPQMLGNGVEFLTTQSTTTAQEIANAKDSDESQILGGT